MEENETFTVMSYTLKSIFQVEKMYYVIAVKHPTEAGKFKLEKYPLRFMGSALVKERELKKTSPDAEPELIDECEYGIDAVGLVLESGFFETVNDYDNFAGLLFEGDPMRTLLGF